MKRIAIVLFTLFSIVLHAEQLPVPPLWGHHVHDEANVLAVGTVDDLEQMLIAHEKATSNQIAVLVIPSLEGNSLEEYSLRVARDWKLGQKKKNNGVLLLIVVNDRKMRIEVGKGLTELLTDAGAAGIIKNRIAPAFRDQDYGRGVLNGVKGIIAIIGNGEELELPSSTAESTTAEAAGSKASTPTDTTVAASANNNVKPAKPKDTVAEALGVFFIFAIVVALSFLSLRARSNFVSWFMYIFFLPFYTFPGAVHPAAGVVSFLAFLILYPILRLRYQNSMPPRYGSKFDSQPNPTMPPNAGYTNMRNDNSGYVNPGFTNFGPRSDYNYNDGYNRPRSSGWLSALFTPPRRVRHYHTHTYRNSAPSSGFWFGGGSSRRRDSDDSSSGDDSSSSSSSSRGFSGGGGGFSGGGASGSW